MYNVLQCCQRKTKSQLSTLGKNLVKFGPVVFEICEQTDKQDILITILCTPARSKVIKTSTSMQLRSNINICPKKNYNMTIFIILYPWPLFQDNLGKPLPERQNCKTILDFNEASAECSC